MPAPPLCVCVCTDVILTAAVCCPQVPPPNQVDSSVGESSIAPTAVRQMLQSLYDSPDMVVPPLDEEEEEEEE